MYGNWRSKHHLRSHGVQMWRIRRSRDSGRDSGGGRGREGAEGEREGGDREGEREPVTILKNKALLKAPAL